MVYNAPVPQDVQSFTVSPQEAHLRLDQLLPLRYPQHSRSYFQFLIHSDCILVNGQMCKKRAKPRPGDEILVRFLPLPDSTLAPEPIPLDVVYEDAHFLAINKPVGMVVHPAPGNPRGTIVNALLAHCKGLDHADPVRPGIVHRLDKDTSGVLLLAKTAHAHKNLVALFASRRVKKTYVALCLGRPKEGWIDAPIKRHPMRRKEMTINADGKEAKTEVRVMCERPPLCLVELMPLTGRTHQLRVHLKHIGTPILGDAVYGNRRANAQFQVTHQLLHAQRLELPHPVTFQPMVLETPLPESFRLNHFSLQ